MTITLTHEQARSFLNTQADSSRLPDADQSALANHLHGCAECRAYAGQLASLQADLDRLFAGRWQAQGMPVHLDTIRARSRRLARVPHFTPRLAWVMTLILVGFILLGTLYTGFGAVDSAKASPMVPAQTPMPGENESPTPTPSAASCADFFYTVVEGDTLASIASQFGLSEETLRQYNGELPQPGNTLRIPGCTPTPGSSYTPTYTITPKGN